MCTSLEQHPNEVGFCFVQFFVLRVCRQDIVERLSNAQRVNEFGVFERTRQMVTVVLRAGCLGHHLVVSPRPDNWQNRSSRSRLPH